MQDIQARTETALDQCLPAKTIVPGKLHDAMRYATLGGGKRVRPLLTHAAGSIFDAAPAVLDQAACAVELIHAYSLVHDDLPCMDDDSLRRGKPTVHIEFDEATAMLAGDALQSLAFHAIATPGLIADGTRQVRMIELLAHASGSRGMAGGQAFDLDSVGKQISLPDLEFMHIHKTGALIRAAVLLGAHCGNADEAALTSLARYANRVGLLFQVIDDILDTEADTATLGKTAGKDEANNKPTYASLLGLSRAKALAAEMRDEAQAALSDFGDRARRLHALTDFIVARTF
ncbi:MAG TPA: farnesyl diphosphate synthase [Rhodocyclaceae bacterium]|nr:farnesyl diphosphate synthase [Rhodocyclaceae bacterium]